MRHAQLVLTVPEEVWISELSRRYPDCRFRVLAATANEANGFARIELLGNTVGAVAEAIETYETVSECSTVEREPGRCRIRIETSVPIVLNAIQAAGIPLDLPVEIVDGELALELAVPQEKLSTFGDTLDSFGISYSVERIQQYTESDSLLTERQEWLLREAIERGYYDSPRRIALVELADEVGIAKSTCSETLHRAEGQVLKQFMEDECEHQPEIPIHAD